ncbi:MAG: C10 family peptidase [Candidatus Cloacimonetes bacterium]|nr:C10 family peptidase [Candidatus Cloacimonadota bacterium]MCF7813145.1 C10 family peptidase [Candidatus Cloacimonadota bacterium]MCF7867593.1 C10 family peptidase [Candidatus Cloacimonadota bacterium]MCF7883132.1 C10 family peptidase [Candidatus Cloacimonadota bacterium]
MKKLFMVFFIISIFLLNAAPTTLNEARQKAEEFLIVKNVTNQIDQIEQFTNNRNVNIAFLANLSPQGFVLVSADNEIHPILAYSFLNDFTSDPNELEIMKYWLGKVTDSYLEKLDMQFKQKNQQKWNNMLSTGTRFEQWPPAGTTPTGGWLETNWTQSYPYNQFCPIDPQNSQRCVAGCPSIVMSQILNFHREINHTQLSDDDDYHMYSSGANNYIIDDDNHDHGFLSYPELNNYLNQIEDVYSGEEYLTPEQSAALVFACGAAIKQSYASNISGNYYDQQIINAFRRFGFYTTDLLWEDEPHVFKRLAENMKAALPARLGILAPTAGHQIVVDGYNTDEEYHFNFGWGGGYNGWYSFPLSGMPYQLNMFGSVDIDINQTWQNCPDFNIISPEAGTVFNTESNMTIQIEETGITAIDSIDYFVDNDLIQTGLYPIGCSFDLSMLGNGNHKITVIAYAEDNKLRAKSVDFEITRGNVIFEENFDGSWENNWELNTTNPDFTWQILENSLESFSETNSNSTHSATSLVAYANLNEVMISPEIQLPVADYLDWNFYVGFCDRYPNYPGITASISNDDGTSWTDLWQTANIGLEEWTWKYVSLDLTNYIGQTVKIKYTCSGFSYADVSIDGIRIIEPQEVQAQNNLVEPQIELTNYPNPFNPSTTISFNVTQTSSFATIGIYNLKSQKVKTLPVILSDAQHCIEECGKPLSYSVVWNGDDNYGNPVSSGIYFARLKSGKYSKSCKMLLMK